MRNSFILEKATYHYYKLLSEKEKQLYQELLNLILNLKPHKDLQGEYDAAQIRRVISYLLKDRPDIFWFRGSCTLTTRNQVVIRVTFHYLYTPQQTEKMISDILNSSFYKQVFQKMNAARSDFEKALVLYETIIKNTEYETRARNCDEKGYEYTHGIEGVILKHRAVCDGYSRTFQYFCNKFHINCTFVAGKTKRARHSWNLISLYGEYYYVDSTWGDPVFANAAKKDPNYISYDFFCITTAALMESHQPVLDVPMPLCTATKYNYYEFFGLIDRQYSVESVAKRLIQAAKQGKPEATLRYSSPAVYQTAARRLFQGSEIFQALRLASQYVATIRTGTVKYSVDEQARVINIKL